MNLPARAGPTKLKPSGTSIGEERNRQGLTAVREPVGTRRVYRLNEAGLLALRDQLDTFWNRSLMAFKTAVEQGDEEVS